jgi:hypothetical protein
MLTKLASIYQHLNSYHRQHGKTILKTIKNVKLLQKLK